jgi:hypothetical protein
MRRGRPQLEGRAEEKRRRGEQRRRGEGRAEEKRRRESRGKARSATRVSKAFQAEEEGERARLHLSEHRDKRLLLEPPGKERESEAVCHPENAAWDDEQVRVERIEAERAKGQGEVGSGRSERLVGGQADKVERPVVVVFEAVDEVSQGETLAVVHLAWGNNRRVHSVSTHEMQGW